MAGDEDLAVTPRLTLPAAELHATFARSGGPGGQNVNKVASKVVLRWSPATSEVLSEAQRARLEERLAARLTGEGEVVIHASRHRTRARNVADARERLAELVRDALAPQKARKPTKPTRGSKRRRLDAKKRRSETKQRRRGLGD